MNKLILFFSLLISGSLYSQLTQNVKGRVVDKETGIGLPGAIVQLKSATGSTVATADNNGYYKLKDVPVGRQSFLFTYTGYKSIPINNAIINSGKEVVLDI